NRDESIFFFQQQRNTEVFNLTTETLKERLDREFGANANAMLAAYLKSRPEASPTDLYIAITTARMIGIGTIAIAERKYAQHGASVYMYIFTHESNNLVPGTQHKVGAAHAAEIPYKFYNVQPPGRQGGSPGSGLLSSVSGPESEKAAHNM